MEFLRVSRGVSRKNSMIDANGRWAGREIVGIIVGMEATVDSVGRIVIPKPLREALGLLAGSRVDVSMYGTGLQVIPGGRTARLAEVDGALIAESDTVITDETMFGLIDAGRR